MKQSFYLKTTLGTYLKTTLGTVLLSMAALLPAQAAEALRVERP